MESKINSLVSAISETNNWIKDNGDDMDLESLDVLYNALGILAKDLTKEIKTRELQRFPR